LAEPARGLRVQIEQYKVTLKNTESQFASLYKNAKEQETKRDEQHADELKKHEAQLAVEIEAGKKKLTDIAEAYNAHMALAAPVTYWESQGKGHNTQVRWLIGATIIWAVVALAGLYGSFYGLLTGTETFTIAGVPLPKVPLWHAAFILILLTFVLWSMRILVRILLSRIHLATGAGERVVMAKTYLALLRDGAGPKDADRQLILQTLFRPSVTGVVHDDAMTAFEWMTRLGSK